MTRYSNFIGGFSVRMMSFYLQTMYPAYLVYYLGVKGLTYWLLVFVFWISAGFGTLLPYFAKGRYSLISVFAAVISAVLLVGREWTAVFSLIGLSALVSGLTGAYTFLSFKEGSFSGVLAYSSGLALGLFVSTLLIYFVVRAAKLPLELSGIILLLFSLITALMMPNAKNRTDIGYLRIGELLASLKRTRVELRMAALNTFAWVSFFSYVFYFLYYAQGIGSEYAIGLLTLTTLIISMSRIAIKDKTGGRTSLGLIFMLYALAFFMLNLNSYLRSIYVLVIAFALVGVAAGVGSPYILYKSLRVEGDDRSTYNEYIAYNAYTGAGELLSNLFFFIVLELRIVGCFYAILAAVIITVILIDQKLLI
ncbi:MAG: hypothetical protein ACP5GH_00370 [Nitrososphaeria archaeon]